MIGKVVKGKSFKGCVSYVLEKSEARLLCGEGVLLNDTKSIINSFYMQSLLNPGLTKCVGHVPLSYHQNDTERLTDEFMIELAKEYMQAMKIVDTQYIIVRHSDNQNPHCHIVFNRVDNKGKTISDQQDYHRNKQVTKTLKIEYGLTFGEGKKQVRVQRLKEPDKSRYTIYHAVKDALQQAVDWKMFEFELNRKGVDVHFKYKGKSTEVQGISFQKGCYHFKGSEVDRSFSYSKLNGLLGDKITICSQKQERQKPILARTDNRAEQGLFLGISSYQNDEEDVRLDELRTSKRKKRQ